MPIARRKDSAPSIEPLRQSSANANRDLDPSRNTGARARWALAPRRWLAPIATFYRRYAVRPQLRTVDHRMIMDLGGHDRVWREY
jgi:hypothetical protein